MPRVSMGICGRKKEHPHVTKLVNIHASYCLISPTESSVFIIQSKWLDFSHEKSGEA